MQSSFGQNYKVTIYGGSHEPEIGVKIEGFPEFEPDGEVLQAFLDRRAPGNSPFATPRKEPDKAEKVSDEPLHYIIKNTNTRSQDYKALRNVPRPGHADYTAFVKYGRSLNMAGGGPFSARLTAPMCIAGGIAIQYLEKMGIKIHAEQISAGGVTGPEMYDEILDAKAAGDSVGGEVRVIIEGCPAGIGGPMYGGLESFMTPIFFGIPGLKGISFGAGFDVVNMRGSENNDPFTIIDGRVETVTNNAGGILGGITTGMPIVINLAMKPTPSISMEQDSINLEEMKPEKLSIQGRHDPCIAVRAVPVAEAAAALGLLDAILGEENER